MIQLLLFLSIVLNIIALFSIVILYLRQNRFLQAEKRQEQLFKEMEDAFSAYLLEMKEENERFLKKLKENEKTKGKADRMAKMAGRKAQPDPPKKKEALEQKEELPIIKGTPFQAARAYGKNKAISARPQQENNLQPALLFHQNENEWKEKHLSELPLNEQVLILQKKGMNIEEIARKLNKGKTEIELLLKFRQNHED